MVPDDVMCLYKETYYDLNINALVEPNSSYGTATCRSRIQRQIHGRAKEKGTAFRQDALSQHVSRMYGNDS